MRLEKVFIENFRSYKEKVVIEIKDLTVFVGKNDIGKSTILEALDIFFNEGKGLIKIDKQDINKEAMANGNDDTVIGVVFSNFPSSLTIDAVSSTKIADEYLLNKDGNLEIIKRFSGAAKERVFLKANHPTNEKCANLLLKKIDELKKMLIDEMVCKDKTKSSEIRKAIWSYYKESLALDEIEIEISKLNEKNVWEQLKNYLPLYALFQSDRKNKSSTISYLP